VGWVKALASGSVRGDLCYLVAHMHKRLESLKLAESPCFLNG